MTSVYHNTSSATNIHNIAGDRANISKIRTVELTADSIETETLITDKLIVNAGDPTPVEFPDGALIISTRGAGTPLTALPEGGDLVGPNQFYLRTLTAGTDLSFVVTDDNITLNSGAAGAVTLDSAGGTTLVSDGVGPDLVIKGITGGTGISITDNTTDLIVTNTSSLASAGGTTLVSNGALPNFLIKGLSAGTGISINNNGTDLQVVNSSPASSIALANGVGGTALVTGANPAFQIKSILAGAGITVTDNGTNLELTAPGGAVTTLTSAGGTPIVTDGTGPLLTVKGTANSFSMRDESTLTTIVFDNHCIRISDTGSTMPPAIDPASNTGPACVVIGPGASSVGNNNVVIGRGATATANTVTVVGANATAANDGCVSLGETASSTVVNAIAIGMDSVANGSAAIGIGRLSSAVGTQSICIGQQSSVNVAGAVAIGGNSIITDNPGVTIGQYTRATAVTTSQLCATIGFGVSGSPLNNTVPGLLVGQRSSATSSNIHCFFGESDTGQGMAMVAGRLGSAIKTDSSVGPGIVSLTPTQCFSTLLNITGGATTLQFPTGAALNTFVPVWGEFGGITSPPTYVGWNFWVRTNGNVTTLDMSTNGAGIVRLNDGTGVGTKATTGNDRTHWFILRASGLGNWELQNIMSSDPDGTW